MSTALLLIALASPPELGVDVDLYAGIGLRERSDGSGTGVAFAYGVGGGYDVGQHLGDLPLRCELTFFSDTFGGGRGVEAVDVDSWMGELVATAGLDWTLPALPLRLQLLVGPGLRATWTRIEVVLDERAAWSAEAFGALVGGLSYDIGPASAGLRAMWGWPRPRLVHIYATGVWRF